ncbi:hypothetical protein STEG23_038021 [Scotinomys teguina]
MASSGSEGHAGQEGETFLYFAYGSNLLTERIHLRNPSAVFCCVARLQVSAVVPAIDRVDQVLPLLGTFGYYRGLVNNSSVKFCVSFPLDLTLQFLKPTFPELEDTMWSWLLPSAVLQPCSS